MSTLICNWFLGSHETELYSWWLIDRDSLFTHILMEQKRQLCCPFTKINRPALFFVAYRISNCTKNESSNSSTKMLAITSFYYNPLLWTLDILYSHPPDTFICLPKSPCNLPHHNCQLLKTTAVRNIHHDHITTRQNEEPMISCQDLRDIFGHLYPMGLAFTRWAARKPTNGCWTWNLQF